MLHSKLPILLHSYFPFTKAVEYVKEKGKITNREYQEINLVAKPTATRELSVLVEYGVIRNTRKGAGSYYEIIGL